MNIAAMPALPRTAGSDVASGTRVPAAGDTYIATLVKLLDIGEQLKIQSVAMEHARNCAAKRDWPGVQIGLAVLCCAAEDVRKIAAAVNERLAPEIDDATETYGE